uniref:(California timema) hypothetical protein n=1 Tax=Timema californicum TaxID=61474 RepID=A0A7R9P484_TIMCA|nr:unnamed protein product [Timema californicum]
MYMFWREDGDFTLDKCYFQWPLLDIEPLPPQSEVNSTSSITAITGNSSLVKGRWIRKVKLEQGSKVLFNEAGQTGTTGALNSLPGSGSHLTNRPRESSLNLSTAHSFDESSCMCVSTLGETSQNFESLKVIRIFHDVSARSRKFTKLIAGTPPSGSFLNLSFVARWCVLMQLLVDEQHFCGGRTPLFLRVVNSQLAQHSGGLLLLHRRPRPLVQQPLISLQEDTQVNMGCHYVTTLHHHIAHTTLRRHTHHPLFNISEDQVVDHGGELNNSVYSNPSSLSGHLQDKGSKYQSNLNEIDKSEQKSSVDSLGKGIHYEWPQGDSGCNMRKFVWKEGNHLRETILSRPDWDSNPDPTHLKQASLTGDWSPRRCDGLEKFVDLAGTSGRLHTCVDRPTAPRANQIDMHVSLFSHLEGCDVRRGNFRQVSNGVERVK